MKFVTMKKPTGEVMKVHAEDVKHRESLGWKVVKQSKKKKE